ncbi:MAG TPA: MBL fold metallo-hydrolase [Vicinamibacterales bacterium]
MRLWPIIFLLALVTRLPGLTDRLYSNDEATYSALAARLNTGGTMYADAVDHKPPGIVSAYAVIFRLAGAYEIAAVRIALIVIVALTGIAAGELAVLLAGDPRARIAGVLYVLASATGFPDNVQAANTELVLNLPLTVAACAAAAAGSAENAGAAFVLAAAGGVLTGVAALFKYQAAIAGVAWLWTAFAARGRPRVASAIVGGLALGFGLIVVLVLRHYAAANHLDAFLFWGWRYNFSYIASMPLSRQLARAVVRTGAIALWWAPVVVLAARRRRVDLALVWFVAMTVAVCAGGRFFGNYYLMLLPPLSVLAGSVLVPRRFIAAAGTLAAVSVIAATFWFTLRPALRLEDDRYRDVGAWLRDHSAERDRVFVWGDSAQVYVYSHRVMGTRFAFVNYHTGKIWGTGADEADAPAHPDLVVPRAWDELEEDFQRAPPAYLVDAAAGRLHGFDGDPLGRYPAMSRLVASDYRLAASVDGVPIYERGAARERPLAIYFIDVEGGQATLIVAPNGQSLLVDAGYGDIGGRDPKRIVDAATDAGVTKIDYMVISHFHGDHVGGVPELARLLPITTFVDYGQPSGVDMNAMPPFRAYESVRNRAAHLVPKPGDHVPLASVDVQIVSAASHLISKPLAGGGTTNAACASVARHADDTSENARSLGLRLTFGKFSFLDLGDLSWNPLVRLVCPTDLLGPVGLFLVPHHTNDDAAVPAMLAALKPRAIVSNNGPTKGGTPAALALVHHLRDTDVWQLHKSTNAGSVNSDDALLANVDKGQSSYWIKVTALEDGSFTVTNARTKTTRSYRAK